MEGINMEKSMLDYATFKISSEENSYLCSACSGGKIEALASGPLDQLIRHLVDARDFASKCPDGTLKLHLSGDLKGSSWFTKFTLLNFLQISNSTDLLENVNSVQNEMSHLEETRKFHVSLCSKECQNNNGGALKGLDDTGIMHQENVDMQSSDATINQLLRALDLRLSALKEEMSKLVDSASGCKLSAGDVLDLDAFIQHFGTIDSRNLFKRYFIALTECNAVQPVVEQSPADLNASDDKQTSVETSVPKPVRATRRLIDEGVSPAKLAQVERHSSTESEESSVSSDEEHAVAERSRPVVRSSTPRRSASPMRRVQIGRSGSRRSTAIAIKSLSYFPARERSSFDRDGDEKNSCDEDANQPPKKSDSAVKRMSVKDAISLFESKQKDQNPDGEKKKTPGLVGPTKSVLRRWSAGMGDSLTRQLPECVSNSTSQSTSIDAGPASEKINGREFQRDVTVTPTGSTQTEVFISDASAHGPTEQEESVARSDTEAVNQQLVETCNESDQVASSVNEEQVKIDASPSIEEGPATADNPGCARKGSSGVQKAEFYSKYREKRDAKLRAKNPTRNVTKEEQLKVLQEALEQSKVLVTKKTGAIPDRRSSLGNPQRARRSSSPPVLPKKELPKTPEVRKVSPKPLPSSVSSLSSGSLTKPSSAPKDRRNSGVSSSSLVPPSRQKTPSASTSRQPSPQAEQPLQQPRKKREMLSTTGPKLATKAQEQKPKSAAKTREIVKSKSSPASEEKLSSVSKPRLLNKATKKSSSSVVPIESKPLKKAVSAALPVPSIAAKSVSLQPEDSLRECGNLNPAEDNKAPVTTELATEVLKPEALLPDVSHQEVEVKGGNMEASTASELIAENSENLELSSGVTEVADVPVEPTIADVHPDEDAGIMSSAWVEVEQGEVSETCENGQATNGFLPAAAAAPSSPRIRHSLSQMLQTDINEPEIIEWGNAANPPALVFQKESPKGLKRLLKFARKNKGESNANGWVSPSVVSEEEEDSEELKNANTKNKRGSDGHKMNSIFSAQQTAGSVSSGRLRESHGATSSNKASRSFFSLSTFRGIKGNEAKIR